jgi:hypothetical protein
MQPLKVQSPVWQTPAGVHVYVLSQSLGFVQDFIVTAATQSPPL